MNDVDPIWKPARDDTAMADTVRVVRQRAGWRCERCGKRNPTEFHHRKRRSQGGTNASPNIALLCQLCHAHVHANPEEAMRDGWLVSGHDPDPTVPARRGHAW